MLCEILVFTALSLVDTRKYYEINVRDTRIIDVRLAKCLPRVLKMRKKYFSFGDFYLLENKNAIRYRIDWE